MVKDLLLEDDEYYPIAISINKNGDIKPIMYFDGNENPLSKDLIAKYHEILESKIKTLEIRAYAIAYDVTVNIDNEKSDLIAIKIKHIESEEVIIYFYPYTLTRERQLTIGESWGEIQ
jgi:hypothetical protein